MLYELSTVDLAELVLDPSKPDSERHGARRVLIERIREVPVEWGGLIESERSAIRKAVHFYP